MTPPITLKHADVDVARVSSAPICVIRGAPLAR
jgi:hypothetical protein